MRRSAAMPLLQSPDSPSYEIQTSSLYPTKKGHTLIQLLPIPPGRSSGAAPPCRLGAPPRSLAPPSQYSVTLRIGVQAPFSPTEALPVGSGLASLGLRPPTHYIINTFIEHPKIRIIFEIARALPVGSGLTSLGLRPPTHYIINTFIEQVDKVGFLVCEAYL